MWKQLFLVPAIQDGVPWQNSRLGEEKGQSFGFSNLIPKLIPNYVNADDSNLVEYRAEISWLAPGETASAA